jgi:versiconal hemiacetal acetate esterase
VGGDIKSLLKGFEAFGQTLFSKLTFPPPDTSVKSEDKTITDGLKIRIYTPPKLATPGIVGIYTHSGGYIVGNLDSEDELCRLVSKEAGIKIVSLDYRLAPEHQYPTALNDSHAGAIWALENIKQDDGSKSKLVLIGSSAGGGLALGGALKLLDEGFEKDLQGVAALVPVSCHPDAVPPELKSQYTSYDENDTTTLNTKSCMLTTFGEVPIAIRFSAIEC